MSRKHGDASTSGAAIAGLVLGVIAVVSSWIPIVNNFSFFLALIGLVISIVGLVGVLRGKHVGKGLAVAALVINIVAAGIVLVTQSAMSAAIDEVTGGTVSTEEQSTDQDEAADVQDAQQSDAQGAEYAVTIDGCTVTTDYEGAPAIIVDYTFTNNSDDETSFAVACYAKVFQNGVQLDSAIVSEDLGNGYMAQVKPGASTTARLAYSITDQSDVTVEVTELISLDDTILAEATFSVA